MSSDIKWPAAGFQYRCSTGHWVSSHKDDLIDTECPAQFGSPNSTAPVLCNGTLGYSMVDGEEAADHIATLTAEFNRLTALVNAIYALPNDGPLSQIPDIQESHYTLGHSDGWKRYNDRVKQLINSER